MMYLTRFKDNLLVNIRIVFLSVAFVHLVFTAIVTLSIDTTVDDDPKIKDYYYIRWLLLTCWFNLVTLGYLPVRLYCEWKTRIGAGNEEHVIALKKITDIVFTAVLTPTTIIADVVFWLVFLTDASLMAPVLLFNYMPEWAQHSLHTVSLVVIVVDLVLTPRKKPRSLTLHVTLMTAFLFTYFAVICYYFGKGMVAYSCLEFMTTKQIILIFTAIYVCYLIIFKLQWIFIERIWKRK